MARSIRALILLAITGCSLPEWDVPTLGSDAPGVMEAVASAIVYQSDQDHYGISIPGFDYWATPQETWASGVGDCEDFALLALYALKRDAGIVGQFVSVHTAEVALHSLVRADDTDWEPQTGTAPAAGYTVLAVLSYWEAFDTMRHRRGAD